MTNKQLLQEAQLQLAWYQQREAQLREVFTAYVLGQMKLIGLHNTAIPEGEHRVAVLATLDNNLVLMLFRKYRHGETNPGGSKVEWEHFTLEDFISMAAHAQACSAEPDAPPVTPGRRTIQTIGLDITPEWRAFLMLCADLLLTKKGTL